MNSIRSTVGQLGLCVALLIASGAAMAQTAAQLQLFKQLPAAEQQRLMRQFTQGRLAAKVQRRIEPESEPELLRAEDDSQPSDDLSRDDRYAAEQPLQPFGYELFRARPTTFAPVTDVPVPADYSLGPGDTLRLVLYGKESGDYDLVVDRSGSIFLPELGPINVAGLPFAEARNQIVERLSAGKIGVNASLQMGELRSIRIFVAGDARYPGSYTVSGLATMIQALYVSGGVKRIGSLRGIELRRGGQTVSTLDLYELLLRGDSRNDVRLRAGDVVFVPPVAATVAVEGSVLRPAIYELRGESSLAEVLELAGGVVPGAVLDRATIERVTNGRRSLIRSVVGDASRRLRLRGGDIVHIHAPLKDIDDGVLLVGPAQWEGRYAVGSSTKLSSILRSAEDLKPLSDLDFAMLLRRADGGAGLLPMYLNPRRVFMGDESADELLRSGDELHVFSNVQTEELTRPQFSTGLTKDERFAAKGLGLADEDIEADERRDERSNERRDEQRATASLDADSDEKSQQERKDQQERSDRTDTKDADTRQRDKELDDSDDQLQGEEPGLLASRPERMAKFAARLEALARYGEPAQVVEVTGAVRFPGKMPLDPVHNTVVDVLRAAGGLKFTADAAFVDITRAPDVSDPDAPAQQVILRTDAAAMAEVKLFAGDVLSVRVKPGANDRRSVAILGEVVYPGSYHVAVGTTLRELIERAGGVTAEGFAKGAVFTRAELRRKEAYQVARLRKRLRSDLAAASLTKVGSNPLENTGLETLEGLFDELAQYEALGRLVIDLPTQIAGTGNPLTLEDGDTLIIPKAPEEVTVMGEVQFPTSHRWERGLRRDDYVTRSGGVTQLADDGRAFVVRADGSVLTQRGWFGSGPVLEAGDVVVVPMDVTPIEPLNLFASVTQIIYQLALTVAAFNSVGAF